MAREKRMNWLVMKKYKCIRVPFSGTPVRIIVAFHRWILTSMDKMPSSMNGRDFHGWKAPLWYSTVHLVAGFCHQWRHHPWTATPSIDGDPIDGRHYSSPLPPPPPPPLPSIPLSAPRCQHLTIVKDKLLY